MEFGKFSPVKKRSFATAIDCMDGRTKGPVSKFTKKETHATDVDTITDAGIVAGLAAGRQDVVDRVKPLVGISVEKHHSRGIVVGGHDKCAGNPVDKETHVAQIQRAVSEVESWGYGVPVTGVFTEPKKTIFRRGESTRRSWATRNIS